MPTHSAPYDPYVPALEAARGNIGKVTAWNKFGYNTNVGTAYEVIWENGNGYTGWLQSAGTVSVTSTSGNDTSSGTHARKIVIEGLDASFNEVSETITLTGGTPSLGTQSFIRVFRAYVTDVGAYDNTNAGNIVIQISGNIVAIIGIGFGQTEMAVYTVPAGKTLYLMRVTGFQDSNRDILMQLKQRQNADDTSAPVTGVRIMRVLSMPSGGQAHLESNGSITFPAKTDIWIEGKATASGDGVTVMMNGYLVDD